MKSTLGTIIVLAGISINYGVFGKSIIEPANILNKNNKLDGIDKDGKYSNGDVKPIFNPFMRKSAFESKNGWDYEHQIGWANDYPTCGGIRQSPVEIDISTSVHVEDASCLQWENYNNQHKYLTLINNGHTVEASSTWTAGVVPTIRGGPLNGTYRFGVIHWHWGGDFKHGSEHIINGAELPTEMHLVHYSEKFSSLDEAINSGESEALVVVGVTFKLSSVPNLGMAIITKAIQTANVEGIQSSILPLGYLGLNFNDRFYSYIGSLTTPPCHQIVRWIVLETPLNISLEQLLVFRGVVVGGHPLMDNYRHVQPLNGRKIHYYPNCSS